MTSLKTFLLEAWAILRVLSFRRIANAFILTASYLYSYFTNKLILKGNPMAFAIEPTSICNLRCPECPTGANLLKRPRGIIDLEQYSKTLKQLSSHLMYLNLYIQGEPMMHPQFGKIVQEAHQFNLYTSTSTNGHFLTPVIAKQIVVGKLTRLIFSVDGTNQKSYSTYRIGGDFERVKKGIEYVIKAKSDLRTSYPIVIMQFLVFKHNEHELPAIKQLAKTLKVDKLEIKTAQLNDFGTMQPPQNKKLSRYADAIGTTLKHKTHNRCWRQWHSATITWDGQFAPCCYDKDAEHAFGNTRDSTINTLWFGKKSIDFKKSIFLDRSAITMCKNCPEGRTLF